MLKEITLCSISWMIMLVCERFVLKILTVPLEYKSDCSIRVYSLVYKILIVTVVLEYITFY